MKLKTLKDINMRDELFISSSAEYLRDILQDAAREWIKEIDNHTCDFKIKDLRLDITLPEQYLLEWIKHFFNLEE